MVKFSKNFFLSPIILIILSEKTQQFKPLMPFYIETGAIKVHHHPTTHPIPAINLLYRSSLQVVLQAPEGCIYAQAENK